VHAIAEVKVFGDARLLPFSQAFEQIPGLESAALTPGKVNASAGRWVIEALTRMAGAARRGEVDGIVFAPLNKQAMKLGGLAYNDEQHLFAALLESKGYSVEFNVIDRLWTSRVTSHIPLKDVAASVTADGVLDAVRIIDAALRRGGEERPRIAVAGLNPHAGEGGTMGREEIELIAPAIARAREEGIEALGPFPADTVFLAAKRGDYDAVVTMYHDQGQIAMKLMGFDRGVTVLGGLPVPIATCAHGTAYDIVGRKSANPVPLMNAFQLAARMASHQEKPGC
jgi:4-hydroxythreonine-4-phosphate dehydrogenase